jgi:mRNA interferase MazF
MATSLLRGQVYRAKLGTTEPKYYLVVSNNRRNAALDDVLVVRLTTTAKPPLPSIVELGPPDPFTGRACCDDITWMAEAEVQKYLGALTPATMKRIEVGLRAALAITG